MKRLGEQMKLSSECQLSQKVNRITGLMKRLTRIATSQET